MRSKTRHTMDTVGWAAILPQMLAALGALFAIAGVGHVVSDLVIKAQWPTALLLLFVNTILLYLFVFRF